MIFISIVKGDNGPAKDKKNGTPEPSGQGKNNRNSNRSSRGRHRSRGGPLSRPRSAPRGPDGAIIEYTDFAAPIFSAGLADYGTQDSAFVTPFVGVAVGGVGLGHVHTNATHIMPTNGFTPVSQPLPKPAGDAVVVKDLVRRQV